MQLLEVSANQITFPHSRWHFNTSLFQSTFSEKDSDFLIGCKTENQIFTFGRLGQSYKELPQKINVLLIDTNQTEIDAFGMFLKYTFQTPKVPLEAEWAKILKIYKEHFNLDLSKDGIPPHLLTTLRQCGLEPHLGVLTNKARFQFLSFEELHFLIEKKWDPTSFELFETMPAELRSALFQIAHHDSMSAQLTKEFANHSLTITRKLSLKAALTLLQSPKQNIDDIRTSLFRTAQPELYSMSEERIQKLRGLKAPARTVVFGDPSFESDGIRITHTPRNLQDLELFKSWIDNDEIMEKFKSIFEFYQQ